jgi:hypothetical protein
LIFLTYEKGPYREIRAFFVAWLFCIAFQGLIASKLAQGICADHKTCGSELARDEAGWDNPNPQAFCSNAT